MSLVDIYGTSIPDNVMNEKNYQKVLTLSCVCGGEGELILCLRYFVVFFPPVVCRLLQKIKNII